MKRTLRRLYLSLSRKKFINLSTVGNTELIRCLSTFDLTLVGIGSTLGSGIYVLTGEVAKNKSGPAIVISFLIAAIVSILSGLCYAEFAARVPKAGSAYIYCYLTIGEFCAFLIAWNLLLEYIIGAAAIARAVSAYIDSLTGGYIQNGTIALIGEPHVTGISHYIDLFSFSIVLFFTILLCFGIKNSARLNNLCVCINLLTILTIIFVGAFYTEVKNWEDFAPFGVKGIIAGSASCFFAFIGFDVIATTSEEAQNPSRSIPISMIGTISVCFLAYFGVSAVVTLMIPYQELDVNAAVAMAFHQKNLGFMGIIIGIGATAGLLGTTLVSLMPAPRLLYALAQDGMLFRFFSKVHANTGVPIFSTISAGLFVAFMAAVLDLSSLVEMLSIGALLAYGIVVTCVLILRYRLPDECLSRCSDQYEEKNVIKFKTENIDMETMKCEGGNSNEDDEFVIDANASSKTCFDDGCTRHNNPLMVNCTILMIIIFLMIISFVLSLCDLSPHTENAGSFLVLILSILVVIVCGIYLQRRETIQNDKLNFQVPWLPWVPILALFFNMLLTFQLSLMTWYRFLIWLFIGFIVYFTYSINHSEERSMRSDEVNDTYTLLQEAKTKRQSERSPLVSPVKIE